MSGVAQTPYCAACNCVPHLVVTDDDGEFECGKCGHPVKHI